jgi:hypothetical protein
VLVGLDEAIAFGECRIMRASATSESDPPASVPQADRAMEVSGGENLRNTMIGLLA